MPRQQFTPEQHSVRVLKVSERVRHILSELLARQEVHDERVSAANIAVTEVRMTPDLRSAVAYVKPLLGAEEAEIVKALQQNTAYLQREVAKRLGLKFAPKLQFRSDESFDEAERIENLLRDPKVARDLDASES
ncbi:MAG: 30S ribosome-binding factor RbfA [Alphaproteobacteria bacterium]|nr:MAG: 30S ribosome-binding factor RbfA [Alphaproteobacteria bacterium]